MEDDSFRQESPVNTSRETFFFPEFDLNKFSSLKSFLECFDKQCLEYQKTSNGRSKIFLDISREFILNFEFQKFLVIKKISTPCEWISTMRQLIAVTPDSADRKPVDTGSYTRWNHAYGGVHRGTGQQYRFQARGNHGQPHQSHMMRFSGNQQYNSQPRQFVQQNRHNLYSPRNENNQRKG
ncbi:hypothetical protein TNCV_1918121 [Trichonephila clavipes]|nr:hypothetical protein TNCV_1918121 [Trichonephila clavipes]